MTQQALAPHQQLTLAQMAWLATDAVHNYHVVAGIQPVHPNYASLSTHLQKNQQSRAAQIIRDPMNTWPQMQHEAARANTIEMGFHAPAYNDLPAHVKKTQELFHAVITILNLP